MLPADPLVLRGHRAPVHGQPHQIDHRLLRAAPCDRVSELRRGVAHDDDVRPVDDLVDRFAEQRRQVRDLVLDVFAVRADQPRERDVAIVDLQV